MTRGRSFEPHDDAMASGQWQAIRSTSSWAQDKNALTKWLVGIITTAVGGLCGWLWMGFNAHETRLVVIETQQKIDTNNKAEEQRRLDTRLDRTDMRLDRMNEKLDLVLTLQRRDLHSEAAASASPR